LHPDKRTADTQVGEQTDTNRVRTTDQARPNANAYPLTLSMFHDESLVSVLMRVDVVICAPGRLTHNSLPGFQPSDARSAPRGVSRLPPRSRRGTRPDERGRPALQSPVA
jgi:hypothetical protein